MSFYPGCGQNIPTLFSTHDHSKNEDNGLSDDNTGLESKEEWLSVPQSLEPATGNPSKVSNALAIEVSFLFLLQVPYNFVCSGQFGRTLLPPLS